MAALMGPLPTPFKLCATPFDIDAETDGLLPTFFEQMVLAVTDLCAGIEVGISEQLPDFLTDFTAVAVGMALDDAGKFHLQAARHDDAVVVFHDVEVPLPDWLFTE